MYLLIYSYRNIFNAKEKEYYVKFNKLKQMKKFIKKYNHLENFKIIKKYKIEKEID